MQGTFDRLATERRITTYFPTAETGTDGTWTVVVETTHNKYAKRIDTGIYAVQESDGFLTRSVTLYAGPSIGAGITLYKVPAARWSANKAAEAHDFVLTNIGYCIDAFLNTSAEAVAVELRRLLSVSPASLVTA